MDLVEVAPRELTRRHPWEEARFAFFVRVLRSAGVVRPGVKILDVGSGDGWFANRLAAENERPEIVAWDTGYASRALPDPAPGVRFTDREPAGRFDAILALDVAEHVDDDVAFATGIVRDHLAEGGHVLVSVPAWPALYSNHDRRLGHVRRYTPRSARELLERSGLSVTRSGGLFHSLLVPRRLQLLLEPCGATAPHAGEWRGGAWTTDLARLALGCDTRASELFARLGWEVPGLSWWALCRAR